jgi:hypothetical protein
MWILLHILQTYSKQPQYLRTHILIGLIMRLCMPYSNVRHS